MPTAANMVTASRLVFFVLFIWFAHKGQAGLAAALFVPAWGLDAVDGWLARRLRQETAFGYVFDKVVDRTVLFAGLLVLVITGLVPPIALLVLTKDVVVVPAVVRQIVKGDRISSLGRPGKYVSFLQGAAIVWALLGGPYVTAVVLLTAAVGGIVGLFYVRRSYVTAG